MSNRPIDWESLRAPFPDHLITFAPKRSSGNRSQVYAHTRAEAIYDLLNSKVGAQNWMWSVVMLPSGACVGTLGIFDPEKNSWVMKSGVGTPSRVNIPRENITASLQEILSITGPQSETFGNAFGVISADPDSEKGAESDAFKRAAAKFGIGREFYDQSCWVAAWMPWDKQNRRPGIPREHAIAMCRVGPDGVPLMQSDGPSSRGNSPAPGAGNMDDFFGGQPAQQQYAPPPQQYAQPAQQQYAPPAQQYAPPAQQYAPPVQYPSQPQQYAPPQQQYQQAPANTGTPPPQQYPATNQVNSQDDGGLDDLIQELGAQS